MDRRTPHHGDFSFRYVTLLFCVCVCLIFFFFFNLQGQRQCQRQERKGVTDAVFYLGFKLYTSFSGHFLKRGAAAAGEDGSE